MVGAGTASEREGYRAKSSRDQEAKASGSGKGGGMAQTQRAANVKGCAGARASVSVHNIRGGGGGVRTGQSLERQAELRCRILGQQGAAEGFEARE